MVQLGKAILPSVPLHQRGCNMTNKSWEGLAGLGLAVGKLVDPGHFGCFMNVPLAIVP